MQSDPALADICNEISWKPPNSPPQHAYTTYVCTCMVLSQPRAPSCGGAYAHLVWTTLKM